jgi:hypothetical protein
MADGSPSCSPEGRGIWPSRKTAARIAKYFTRALASFSPRQVGPRQLGPRQVGEDKRRRVNQADPDKVKIAMDYNPRDHIPTARQIVAAWVVCGVITGLALGMTARHPVVPAAAASSAATAAAVQTLAPCPTANLRLPTFAVCRGSQADRLAGLARKDRGALSLPPNPCS